MSTNASDSKNCILDSLGGILLFVCAVSLIIALVVVFKREPPKPIVNSISLTVQSDSTGVLDAESRKAIDSLTALVKQQDIDVRERYAYFVEQKERENGLITFGGIIISIILGIFGFFGYKSFKSIEEKALSNAEEKVKVKIKAEIDSIKDTIETDLTASVNERFKTEYEQRLGDEVAKKMNESFNEIITTRLSFIELKDKSFKDLLTRVNKIEQFISQLKDNGFTVRPNFTDETGGDVSDLSGERKMKKASQTDKEEGVK